MQPAGTAIFATAPGSSLITVANAADGTAKINMQLGWLASNGICGEVCAKRMGYYDELGIELEVTSGRTRRRRRRFGGGWASPGRAAFIEPFAHARALGGHSGEGVRGGLPEASFHLFLACGQPDFAAIRHGRQDDRNPAHRRHSFEGAAGQERHSGRPGRNRENGQRHEPAHDGPVACGHRMDDQYERP